MTEYRKRELVSRVVAAMRSLPVVVVSGLRQSGKTTFLCEDPALRDRRYVSFDDWEMLEQARRDPAAFVQGDQPITIDEAQRCPELMTAIKREVDKKRRMGHFLLSGSANFLLLESISESLAGRALYLQMHPMTRRELSGRTAQQPFLVGLFATGEPPRRRGFEAVTEADILKGGMPQVALGMAADARLWLKGYEQTYLERDLRDLAQVADLGAFRRVLLLAALRSGEIGNESAIGREAKLSASTVGRYLDLLETSFVASPLPPFVRSRSKRLIRSPRLYVSDSALAAHLMDVRDLSAGERQRGPLFKTYVAQNLRAIVDQHLDSAELGFWNVQGRHEVDFVIATPRKVLAIEVRAAARFGDEHLVGLRAFAAATPGVQALVLAYQGKEVVSLGDRAYAIPIGLLLS